MRKLLLILFSSIVLMGATTKKVTFMRTYGCNYWRRMKKAYNSEIADVIVTQAALESSWGTARWVKNRKQLTATYDLPEIYAPRVARGKPIDKLRIFRSFEEYYDYKSKYYTRKGYNLDSVDAFIAGLVDYAEDPKYVKKITKMYKDITYLRRTVCTDH